MSQIKLCVLGSRGVGKTALIRQFINGTGMSKSDAANDAFYRKTVTIDGTQYSIEIREIAESADDLSTRDLIKSSNGFILVYSITSQTSYNALDGFYNQIKAASNSQPNNPPILVLVGNKADLENERAVPRSIGEDLARKWKCTTFETSVKNQMNIDQVFAALAHQSNKPNSRYQREAQQMPVASSKRPARGQTHTASAATTPKGSSKHHGRDKKRGCILL